MVAQQSTLLTEPAPRPEIVFSFLLQDLGEEDKSILSLINCHDNCPHSDCSTPKNEARFLGVCEGSCSGCALAGVLRLMTKPNQAHGLHMAEVF